jgi:hypothetical protein
MDIYGVHISQVAISGEQIFTKNGKPIGNSTALSHPQSSDLKILTDNIKLFKSTQKDVDETAKSIRKAALDLSKGQAGSSFRAHMGGLLHNIGTSLPSISSGIAGLSVANSLISSFSARGKGGSFDIQFDAATIELSGDIIRQEPMHRLTVGLPGSAIYKDSDKSLINEQKTTVIDGYKGKLGVFSLSGSPKIKINSTSCAMNVCSYLELRSNINQSIILNPYLKAHLEIEEIDYSVEVQTNYPVIPDYVDYNGSSKSCFVSESILGTNPGLVPYLQRSKKEKTVMPNHEYSYVISGKLLQSSNTGHDVGTTLVCYTNNVTSRDYKAYLKVLVKIKNKDTGEKYSYMRKYKADIVN